MDTQYYKTDPYQLQKPEDASLYSAAATASGMAGTANANRNTVVVGGQTGVTQTGLQNETPITEQLIYNTSPAVQKAAATDSDGTLTSAPAKSYVETLREDATKYGTSGQAYSDLQSPDANIRLNAERALAQQKETDIKGYQQQVEGTRISDSSKQAYISQLPPSDPGETLQEKNLRNAVMSGGTAGLLAGQALTSLQTLREDRLKLDEQRQLLKEQQTSESATERATQFRMGQSGGSFASAYTAKKDAERARESRDYEEKVQDFLNSAWDSALTGNLDMAEKFRAEAGRAFSERMQIEQLAMEERKQAMEVQKYEDTRSADAQSAAMNTIGNLVKAGYTPDKLPEGYLDEMDAKAGMPEGFSQNLFGIAQKEQEAQAIKDEAEAKKADIANATAIFKALKDVPAGTPIEIDGNTYFGTQGTGTIEISKEDGIGRLAYVDQATGEIKVKPLGQMGDVKSGNWETVYVNGVQMSHNKNTNEYIPIVTPQGASGEANWSDTIPNCNDGDKGGQCGSFIHRFVADYPYGVNTVAQREAIVNVDKTEVPRIGDVLLQNYGSTGHSAMVNYSFQDEKGNWMVKLTESNYKGDERVMNTRTVSMSDPSVLGLFRGQLKPQAETGSDLPAVEGPVLPGEEFQAVPLGETQADRERESAGETSGGFVIPSGGPLQGFTGSQSEYAKAKQSEQEAIDAAKMLVDGNVSLSDVSTDVRARAAQIASANGWKKQEEKKTATTSEKLAFETSVKTDPWVKDFPTISNSYKSMQSAYQSAVTAGANKTTKAAADQAIITLFNKMLDPTSVVREGEYARSEQGQALMQRAQSWLEQARGGGAKITDESRQEMINIAKAFYGNAREQYTDQMNYKEAQAIDMGIDPRTYINRKDLADIRPKESPPSGEVWVKEIGGGVGSIPESEFDSDKYIRL